MESLLLTLQLVIAVGLTYGEPIQDDQPKLCPKITPARVNIDQVKMKMCFKNMFSYITLFNSSCWENGSWPLWS